MTGWLEHRKTRANEIVEVTVFIYNKLYAVNFLSVFRLLSSHVEYKKVELLIKWRDFLLIAVKLLKPIRIIKLWKLIIMVYSYFRNYYFKRNFNPIKKKNVVLVLLLKKKKKNNRSPHHTLAFVYYIVSAIIIARESTHQSQTSTASLVVKYFSQHGRNGAWKSDMTARGWQTARLDDNSDWSTGHHRDVVNYTTTSRACKSMSTDPTLVFLRLCLRSTTCVE